MLPTMLNSILQNQIVRNRNGCALMAFGCVAWESEYPFSLVHPSNMPVKDTWHARHPLFFKCWNGRLPKNKIWVCCPKDIEAHLVCFSTFEELKLPASATGQSGPCPWIMPPPSCTSSPLLLRLSCMSAPVIWCWAGCHSFQGPCSWQHYSHHTK